MAYPFPSQDQSNSLSPDPSRSRSEMASSNSPDTSFNANLTHSPVPVSYGMPQQGSASQSSYTASGAAATPGGTIPIEFIDYSSSSSGPDDRHSREGSARNDNNLGTTNMHLRRRAQNRASQRAFRDRKERHVKLLEDQLQLLNDQHHSLLQSYSQQTMKVSELNERIEKLMEEINFLQTSYSQATTPFGGGNGGIYLPEDLGDGPPSAFLFTGTEAYGEEYGFLSQNNDAASFSQMDRRL